MGFDRRFPYLLIGFFQIFLLSGTMYGWAAMNKLLLDEDTYSYVCGPDGDDSGEGSCSDQRLKLNLIFTVASSVSLGACLIIGLVLDKWGPRACASMSSLLVISGSILVAFGDPPSFDSLLPGFVMIAFGGPGLLTCNIQLSNLYPEYSATVTFILNAAFQVSFEVFQIFDFMHDADNSAFSRRNLFLGMAVIGIAGFLLNLWLWPDSPFSARDSVTVRKGTFNRQRSRYLSVHNIEEALLPDEVEVQVKKPLFEGLSLQEQLMTQHWWGMTVVVAVAVTWSNIYIGTVGNRIQYRAPNDKSERDSYNTIFNTVLPFGAAVLLLIGRLIEKWGMASALGLTFFLGIIYSSFSLMSGLSTQLATFGFYALFRSLLFALIFTYFGVYFGFRNFGMLTGITFAISGVVGLLQYPIAAAGEDRNGDFTLIDIIQLCCFVPLFYHAWYCRRSTENRIRKDLAAIIQPETPPVTPATPLPPGMTTSTVNNKAGDSEC